MWLRRRPLLQVLIISAVVHAGLLLATIVRHGQIDGYAFNSLDCREYYAIAHNLAAHGVFSQDEKPPLTPDTWRTPGYPLFLAFFMFLFGDSSAMLVVVQQLLSVLNVLLLFSIVRRIARDARKDPGTGETRWIGERGAMIVAILFLVEPFRLLYSLWLMSTTLFVTVLLLTWLVWLRTLESRRWEWFGLLGTLSGLLILVRPVGILVPAALFPGLIIALARRKRHVPEELASEHGHAVGGVPCPSAAQAYETEGDHGRNSPTVPPAMGGCRGVATGGGRYIRPRHVGAFAVICALVVGSWMLRNHRVAKHFALSDQGGVVLAYFKATEVVLWEQGRSADRYQETTLNPAKAELPHTVWEDIDARLRLKFAYLPEELRTSLRWANLAQGNRTRVDSFSVSAALREIGWSYLTASPLSTATCCLVRCGSILTFPLNLAIEPPTGVPIGRIGSALTGSVYLLLCVWVVVRLLRGGLSFEQVYFPLACTIALLLATTPQIDPRFRVPMVPLLLVIALMPRRTTVP